MSGITNNEKMKTLALWKNNLSIMQNIIDDMMDGISEDAACRKHGIDKRMFRSVIFRKSLNNDEKKAEIREKLKGKTLIWTPEEKIWCAMNNVEDFETFKGVTYLKNSLDIPCDLDETIPDIISKLPERDQNIIKDRFYDGLSLEEIGKKLNITRERVARLNNQAIHKLKNYKEYCIIGRVIYKDKLEAQKNFTEEIRKKLPEEINKKYSIKDINGNMLNEKIVMADICELDFSTRIYNCLRRAGCVMVGDIVQYAKTPDDLYLIRSIGKKGVEEIINKCHAAGVVFDWEKEFLDI